MNPTQTLRLSIWSCLFVILWGTSTPAFGQQPPAFEQIQQHTSAGEFTLAFEKANQLSAPEVRDQALTNVAQQQLRAGLSHAAVETSSYISDDQSRSQFLSSMGQRGGGFVPNFDEIQELITTTVVPESWEELGGPGSIAPFSTGVYVDPNGTLNRVERLRDDTLLIHVLSNSIRPRKHAGKITTASPLRKVSLKRLEKEVQLRWALGQAPTDAMRNLAGIYRVKYLLYYPEQRELVIAGPAGDWKENAEGRIVSANTNLPVLQLDDLVVLLRNSQTENGIFGCSITPTQRGLQNAKQYLESQNGSLHPRQRTAWLKGLRDSVGKQLITVHGIPVDSRTARIIVEADYHMKRIGMGLEDGTVGVPSYLEMVTPNEGAAQPMDVLRWWFTLNFKSIQTDSSHRAFTLNGPGVKVLSENEHIDQQGQRIHTNKSSTINSTFARNFTQHYEALSVKYPIYADMRNIFDLAMITSLVEKERLADQIDWQMTHFGPEGTYQIQRDIVPKDVETIMNMRVIDRKHIIAGVSGGVYFDPATFLDSSKYEKDEYGLIDVDHKQSELPPTLEHHGWWWD